MIRDRIKLSKFLSFILRHKPQKYNLCLDNHGFADFDEVCKIIKTRFIGVKEKDIEYMVENDPNARFEIRGRKIRACYGHSVEVEPFRRPCDVPDYLFHGTSPKYIGSILKEGLKPQSRKFVHLSLSVDDALRIGKRKSPHPVILKIEAKRAKHDGVLFWREANVYLTREIPGGYISVYKKLGGV